MSKVQGGIVSRCMRNFEQILWADFMKTFSEVIVFPRVMSYYFVHKCLKRFRRDSRKKFPKIFSERKHRKRFLEEFFNCVLWWLSKKSITEELFWKPFLDEIFEWILLKRYILYHICFEGMNAAKLYDREKDSAVWTINLGSMRQSKYLQIKHIVTFFWSV